MPSAMLRTSALLLAALCVVQAHICLISPVQRGATDLSFPGARECFRKQGPCGINTAGDVRTTLQGGQSFAVQFQQNLNHFTVADPGWMDASIALVPNPTEADFKPFGAAITDYNAYNMITQTNFTLVGTVPNVNVDRAVLRVRYVSNNPKEATPNGTNFYNCADVRIVARKDSQVLPEWMRPAAGKAGPGPQPCCTVKQWAASTYQTGSWRPPTGGYIAYDAAAQLMRIDTTTGSGRGSTIYDGSWQMYLNFTSGLQWFLDLNSNQCLGYHLDVWQDWCYGASQKQTFQGNSNIADTVVDVWGNGEFSWAVSHNRCTPTWMYRSGGDLTLYSNVQSTLPAGVFEPPAVCSHHLRANLAAGPPPVSVRDALALAGHPLA